MDSTTVVHLSTFGPPAMHHQLTLRVRQFVHTEFQALGVEPDVEPFESLLIQNGFFSGRRFKCEDLEAIWRFEENTVTIFDATGSAIKVYDVASDSTESRVA